MVRGATPPLRRPCAFSFPRAHVRARACSLSLSLSLLLFVTCTAGSCASCIVNRCKSSLRPPPPPVTADDDEEEDNEGVPACFCCALGCGGWKTMTAVSSSARSKRLHCASKRGRRRAVR